MVHYMTRNSKIFIIVSLLFSWIMTVVVCVVWKKLAAIALIMFCPGITAFIMRLFVKRGQKGIIFNPEAKGFTRLLLGVLYAHAVPVLVITLCAVWAALYFSLSLNSAFFHQLFSADLLWKNIIPTRLASLLVFVSGFITAFGEEYGWRGFLLPELLKSYSKIKASTVVGIVWALFHIPAVFFLNYTSLGMEKALLTTGVQALAAFFLSYVFCQCYLISFRVLPVVLMHRFWNAYNPRILGSVYENKEGLIFRGYDHVLLINGEGVFGVIIGAIFAAVVIFMLYKGNKKSSYL